MIVFEFEFRDKDQNVLKSEKLNIHSNINYRQLEELFAKWLIDQTVSSNGSCKTSASISIGHFISNKEWSDGTHYFMKDNNDFGFTSSYLYLISKTKI